MGKLIDGRWHDVWYNTKETGGKFVRQDSVFRNWLTADGSPGPSGKGGFVAEPDRYHLFVSYACPWAHRTLIFRKLKQLEELLPYTVVHPHMLSNGWELRKWNPQADRNDASEDSRVQNQKTTGQSEQATHPNFASVDSLYGHHYLYQLYTHAESTYTGRVTVPVLWDKKQQTIVSNESADIIRMLNAAFNDITGDDSDYYPHELRGEIDAVNELVYNNINNGVYRTGFATTQEAYESAYNDLFTALDEVEARLQSGDYLVANRLTEADWRLFTTLIRFDSVYYSHFKCCRNRISDFPALSQYVRRLYAYSGIAETVHMDHIKEHYFYSHGNINPTRIVPVGPELDFMR